MSLLDAAAVEQDVYSVAVGQDAGDEGGDGGSRGEVCGIDCGFAAEGFDLLFGSLAAGVTLEDMLMAVRAG